MTLALKTLEAFGLSYRLNGTGVYVLCPFHEERKPSLHMDVRRGIWTCFGCGAKGNLLNFATRLCHGDELDALAVIARARGASLRGPQPEQFCWQRLPPVDPVVGWSRFRRVNWELEPDDDPVVRYLTRERRFRREILNAFDVRRTSWPEYPVAFPLFEKASLVGYVRRRIDDGHPKYRYNVGFRAEDHVVYYSVDDSIPCLLVEGLLDFMKAVQHGYRRVAALLGWKLTDRKRALLEGFGVDRVVCALDNTVTGEAGWKVVKAAWPGSVRFQYPTHRKDVGEMLVHEFLAGLPYEQLGGAR